jgi:hypothetical protein
MSFRKPFIIDRGVARNSGRTSEERAAQKRNDDFLKIRHFFILGAPKCGTSVLASCLASHENICFSCVKEPHYFSEDINWQAVKSLTRYQQLFGALKSKHKYTGEGSAFYLYSRSAIPKILDFDKSAKFIAMVRNPIDLAVSLHAENRKTGWEEIKDFEQAWRAQEGRRLEPVGRNPHSFLYGDVAKLGVQVERAMRLVARENMHIVVYDDFRTEPLECYKRVLAFLELEYDGRVVFPIVNARHQYRSMWFNRLIVKVSDAIGPDAHLHGALTLGARLMRNLNIVSRPVAEPSAAFREELREHFREDVALLGRMLNRDLSGWR